MTTATACGDVATSRGTGGHTAMGRGSDALPELSSLSYQAGFANHFSSEALAGALPEQNSPQRCPYGLYAEQLSGTAFTAPRAVNRRSWLYRIRPSVTHLHFRRIGDGHINNNFSDALTPPSQLRWDPMPIPREPTDFIDGLVTMAGNGDPQVQSGCGIYVYAANRAMEQRAFYDADGELLIVPQQGRLLITTELGRLLVEPLEIQWHLLRRQRGGKLT